MNGKQRRHLRALGHHLHPVVHAGKQGLTDNLTQAVDQALLQHELIKIRLARECPDDRDDLSARLAAGLQAEVAQRMGNTVLLYRKHPAEPKIVLPG